MPAVGAGDPWRCFRRLRDSSPTRRRNRSFNGVAIDSRNTPSEVSLIYRKYKNSFPGLGVATHPGYLRGDSCSWKVWSRRRWNCKGFE